jgi:hypothetical protein
VDQSNSFSVQASLARRSGRNDKSPMTKALYEVRAILDWRDVIALMYMDLRISVQRLVSWLRPGLLAILENG